MDTPISITKTPYWCFISYRHADNLQQDRSWASWLHQEIERYDVPADLVGTTNPEGDVIPERIYPVFRDEDSLPAESDLGAAIVDALERSRFMIVLCSPKAVESRYVAEEILQFKRLGRGNRIIAAIVAGEPGSAELECFPTSLRHPLGAGQELDHSRNEEPIAADFRLDDGSEGYTSPEGYRLALRKDAKLTSRQVEKRAGAYEVRLQLMKLKIIAGILGVPLERLSERDKAYQLQLAQAKTRKLRRWLAAVAMLSVVAIAGGVVALIKQKQAVDAQRRTVKEMIDASWKSGTFFVQDTETSFEKTGSFIHGTRVLYDHFRLFMDLQKLQSLSPVPVFLSGPHMAQASGEPGSPRTQDFDFKSYDFGHYNPEFVSWAYDNAIPASKNETLRRITQPFYDKFLLEMSRYYYIVYLDVQANLPSMHQQVIPRFMQDLKKFSTEPFDTGIGEGPGKYLQYEVFYDYANEFSVGGSSQNQDASIFDWATKELDFYYASVAGPYWVRRMVDGTSEGLAEVLYKLLDTYDREWLSAAPEAQPHTVPGSRRFPIKF